MMIRDFLDWISVLWIILSTGSLIVCIFNMKFCMFAFVFIALMYLFLDPHCKASQIRAALMIVLFVTVNSLINIRYFEFSDDIIILLMRLFALAVICSNLSTERFQTLFCRIVFFLCILSLPCFLLSEMGMELPGQTTLWFKEKYYIYTFYHTIGRWKYFHRNAGIFWESPAFAIFIITALMMLLLGYSKQTPRQRLVYMMVYSVTLFTTLATTAYVAYILAIVAVILNRKRTEKLFGSGKNSKWIKIGFILACILLIVVMAYIESTTHVIERKLINRQGSYGTRSNDTISGFEIALERAFSGYGLFNNYTLSALLTKGVTDNSNWFSTAFLYFGFPFALIYAFFFCKGVANHYRCSWLSMLCVLGAYFVFINTEQIGTMTLFLFYLFPTNGTEGGESSSRKIRSNKYELIRQNKKE